MEGDLADSTVVQWLSSGESWARRGKDLQKLVEPWARAEQLCRGVKSTDSAGVQRLLAVPGGPSIDRREGEAQRG